MVLSTNQLRSTSPPPSGSPSKPSPPNELNAPTVLLRTVAEHVAAAARTQTHQSGKYCDIVQVLSTPAADLYLSTRPATALHAMNIRHAYGLVALEPRDLQVRPNVGR